MHMAFRNHQEMITLLESYFLTGYEAEDARNAFQTLQMAGKDHSQETFAEFKGRFTSMAILGEIPESELFFYMWEKITPQLRSAAATMKRGWNRNLSEMTADLLALDKERRRNAELQSMTSKASVATVVPKKVPYPKPTPKPFIPSRVSSAILPPRPTTQSPAREDRPKTDTKQTPVPICYNCGKPGHWKSNCPSMPTVKEIEAQMDLDDEALREHSESDPIEEENEEENEEA